MRKVSFIIALLAVIIGGCTKNYYRDSESTNPTYRVDGIQDFWLSEDNPQNAININVVYMNKEQENVTVSVEGLPQGLYAQVFNGSGIPTFNTQISFYDSSAAPGTYKVQLVTTGSVTGRKAFTINVTIKPIVDCKNSLTGVYTGQSFCAASGMFMANVTPSPTVARRILIDNFENSGFQVYVNLVCTQNAINMPAQTINGVVYSGSGYFYDNAMGNQTIYLSYSKRFSTGGMTSCNVTFDK